VNLAVIVPMLNEERVIAETLQALRRGAPRAAIIVVDGGSDDRCVALARPLCDSLLQTPPGRARQMNAGAATVATNALVFVHADTIVPADFAEQIEQALADPTIVGGRFDVELDDPAARYRLLSATINLRSRLMRSATGDQAIFVQREVFARLGGFADFERCEDVDFARKLRRAGGVACLRARVITSARRWRQGGFLRTILRMWTIKALFLLGVAPDWLKRHYADTR
jgi:rSAM/selenodomain-associated transferase 2